MELQSHSPASHRSRGSNNSSFSPMNSALNIKTERRKSTHVVEKDGIPEDMLKEGTRKDISLAKFLIDNVIGGIEDTVVKKEEQRDHKMKMDFEREKDLFLSQQADFKQKIESFALNNINEKMINILKEEKNNQQELYNKYYTLNCEVLTKIKKMKESIPEFEARVNKKKEKLKEINHENLKLLEKIKELENEKKEKTDGSLLIKNNNSESILKEDMSGYIMDQSNSQIQNSRTLKNRKLINATGNSYVNNMSINITELLEESDHLKEKFEYLKNLKEKFKLGKKENKYLSNEVAKLNSLFFNLGKIFTEGSQEIQKELLKIHEIKLDKIVQKNSNGNSLYFELIKGKVLCNINGSFNIVDDQMKLPLIQGNIKKKYNYPIHEKTLPSTSIYNVVKNILEEHQNLNRNLLIKKKKFDWEEFKNFSAYQIYTLISMNKNILKKIENKIFPRSLDTYVNKNSNNVEEITIIESLNKNNVEQ